METATAARFVQLTHMHDWVLNEERQTLATELGLTNHWRSHAAYIEARSLALSGGNAI